jgi:tetraacyldisaccharide 4'-kinase
VTDRSWAGERVVAFAGIGRPQRFFSSLAGIGAQILEARPYGDHHIYTKTEMTRLKAIARARNAVLVTTEKDFVRLTQTDRDGVVFLPVRVEFDDCEPLERLLDRLVPRGVPPNLP